MTEYNYKPHYINPKQEKRQRIYRNIKGFILFTGLTLGLAYCGEKLEDSELVKKIRQQEMTDTIQKPQHTIYKR